MNDVLDHTLFRIGDTGVTVGGLGVCLLILAGSYVVSRLVRRLVSQRLLGHTQLSPGMRYALGRFAGYLIIFLGAGVALQTMGVRLATLAAFGAVVGVGIGFGLQDIVKNFFAGLILLIERPFQVGDRIEFDKATAEVVEVRARATVLRTNDDVHMIVPNAKFITDTVVNRSFDQPLYRSRASVAVDSSSDPKVVEEALLEAARRCDGILADPPPAVRFRAFGDGTLTFEVLGWTEKVHRPGALVSNLNFLIHEELTKRGIRLPTPPAAIRAQV